ncbi:MAG: EAL domain-containing protein, partial [Anaerovorax sp.]
MSPLKTILLIDENAVNRRVLLKILSEEYTVIQAENPQEAWTLLTMHINEIDAVIIHIVRPIKVGYEVLKAIVNDPRCSNLPIVVTMEDRDNKHEIKVLALGAWDFISKPYHPKIINFRLKNAIERSQFTALKQLNYLAEYDELTGIFNKTKFFEATRDGINESCGKGVVFFRISIDRFQLIHSFFGTAEGDKVLIYVARYLREKAKRYEAATYGRIESHIFGFCMPYDKRKTENFIKDIKYALEKYNPSYDIIPSLGICVVEDSTISVEEMYNRATLARKNGESSYVDYYTYYNENMSIALNREQEIINEMKFALERGQFEIYLQPYYGIYTHLPCGAEALVRWIHPERGTISPKAFIPIFERNGFITKLDYYVWERVCKCLRNWIEQGIKPYPISVNVSRVNLYDPKLAETLIELVNRYGIEPALLNLELTESAYTDNPISMKKTVEKLQSNGFVIMMDDFGSGHSSLSLLKDIEVDILKIDIQFLSETEVPGRGENIVASVIRMVKWLDIPVIAEGVETREQMDFLRNVGCDYVQGYYFACPMPMQTYEKLCESQPFTEKRIVDKTYGHDHYDDLFASNQQMELLFNNELQPAVIYEFAENHVEMIRVNEAYYSLLGHEDLLVNTLSMLNVVYEEYQDTLLNAFHTCVENQGTSECEYMRSRAGGAPIWIHIKLRYVSMVGDKHILMGELKDITMRKELDFELQKYRTALMSNSHNNHTILIVDDVAVNRTILKRILQDQFRFLESKEGEEAIVILKEHKNKIDLILLDIAMPKMDGKEFLKYKRDAPELGGIPVIMITADDSPAQQISTLSLGANDYIVKPFIPQVVIGRVKNVLEFNRRFKEMMKECNNLSQLMKTDRMTGLLNRASVEDVITQRLENSVGTCVMLMIDIDNFKKCNDAKGHIYGDKVIVAMAETLRLLFRKEDFIARMGGDEFAVFVENIPDVKLIEKKAEKLCTIIPEIEIEGRSTRVTCSVGVAVSSPQV